jgi:ATP-dependent RNA helicase DDX19/DBP5
MADKVENPEGAQPDELPPASNLQEVSYDVEVSLNELQKDEANPLGSAHTFQELGLYVVISIHDPSNKWIER